MGSYKTLTPNGAIKMETETEDNTIDIGTCPNCKYRVAIIADKIPDKSFICDCQGCGLLIGYEDGKLFDMHAKVHESDPRWPKDGKGTYYAECNN